MPRIHPKPDVIDRMLELLPELRIKVLRHLCDCPTCHALWLGEPPEEPAGAASAAAAGGRVLPWRPPMAEYGAVVDRVLSDIQGRFREAERERAAAPALLEELRLESPAHREWLIDHGVRFQSLPLLHLLLRTADEEVYFDAQEAERWADLALRLADHLDPQQLGARVIEDARARSWSAIANARRVAADLLGSEQAFRAADAHLRLGSRDPLARADVMERKACLLRAQHRFKEAVGLLKRCISIWLSAGERRRVVRTLSCCSSLERRCGRQAQRRAKWQRTAISAACRACPPVPTSSPSRSLTGNTVGGLPPGAARRARTRPTSARSTKRRRRRP